MCCDMTGGLSITPTSHFRTSMKQRNPTMLSGPLDKDNKMIVTDALTELSSTAPGSSTVNPVLFLIHMTRRQLL